MKTYTYTITDYDGRYAIRITCKGDGFTSNGFLKNNRKVLTFARKTTAESYAKKLDLQAEDERMERELKAYCKANHITDDDEDDGTLKPVVNGYWECRGEYDPF